MNKVQIVSYEELSNHLCKIFQIVDPAIQHFSYIHINNRDLFKYEFKNIEHPKYIDVTNLSPYDAFKTAVNTLDHYNLEYMFLSERKVIEIFECPYDTELEL